MLKIFIDLVVSSISGKQRPRYNTRTKHMYSPKSAMEKLIYEQLYNCKEQTKGHIHLIMDIDGKHRSDIDNIVKAVQDIAQDAQVIENDKNVKWLTIRDVSATIETELYINLTKQTGVKSNDKKSYTKNKSERISKK